ncbi:hypothetical protein T5B8_18513, partial [Salinisphaera sp. T5B8]
VTFPAQANLQKEWCTPDKAVYQAKRDGRNRIQLARAA